MPPRSASLSSQAETTSAYGRVGAAVHRKLTLRWARCERSECLAERLHNRRGSVGKWRGSEDLLSAQKVPESPHVHSMLGKAVFRLNETLHRIVKLNSSDYSFGIPVDIINSINRHSFFVLVFVD